MRWYYRFGPRNTQWLRSCWWVITWLSGCEHAHCLQHHGERGHWASHFSSLVCMCVCVKIQPVALIFWLHSRRDWASHHARIRVSEFWKGIILVILQIKRLRKISTLKRARFIRESGMPSVRWCFSARGLRFRSSTIQKDAGGKCLSTERTRFVKKR